MVFVSIESFGINSDMSDSVKFSNVSNIVFVKFLFKDDLSRTWLEISSSVNLQSWKCYVLFKRAWHYFFLCSPAAKCQVILILDLMPLQKLKRISRVQIAAREVQIWLLYKGTRWASWNIGIFLCMRCAGVHRSLGTHISKIKSLTLDKWTDEQIDCILSLGNSIVNSKFNPSPERHPFPSNSKYSFSIIYLVK